MPAAGSLRRTRDYDEVYKGGRRQRSPHFLLIARKNEESGLRVGISVQKRLGNAVVRNKIKRRIREIVRREDWNVRGGVDVVIQPRTGKVAREEFAALREELTGLIRAALKN